MNTTPSLTALADLQRTLEERTRVLAGDPAEVLEVGQAVLRFAASEQEAFLPLLGLLDPAARDEIAREHEALERDLELLRWLVTASPGSPDVEMLAEALTRRMRTHIARDGRLLAQAARMRGAVFSSS